MLNVEDVVKDWMLTHVPIAELDQKKEFETAIQEYLFSHPELLSAKMSFDKTVGPDRLVMLVTNKTYHEVQEMQNSWAYEDYAELIAKCKKVIGFEEVDDFLQRLKANTSTPPDAEKGEQSQE